MQKGTLIWLRHLFTSTAVCRFFSVVSLHTCATRSELPSYYGFKELIKHTPASCTVDLEINDRVYIQVVNDFF